MSKEKIMLSRTSNASITLKRVPEIKKIATDYSAFKYSKTTLNDYKNQITELQKNLSDSLSIFFYSAKAREDYTLCNSEINKDSSVTSGFALLEVINKFIALVGYLNEQQCLNIQRAEFEFLSLETLLIDIFDGMQKISSNMLPRIKEILNFEQFITYTVAPHGYLFNGYITISFSSDFIAILKNLENLDDLIAKMKAKLTKSFTLEVTFRQAILEEQINILNAKKNIITEQQAKLNNLDKQNTLSSVISAMRDKYTTVISKMDALLAKIETEKKQLVTYFTAIAYSTSIKNDPFPAVLTKLTEEIAQLNIEVDNVPKSEKIPGLLKIQTIIAENITILNSQKAKLNSYSEDLTKNLTTENAELNRLLNEMLAEYNSSLLSINTLLTKLKDANNNLESDFLHGNDRDIIDETFIAALTMEIEQLNKEIEALPSPEKFIQLLQKSITKQYEAIERNLIKEITKLNNKITLIEQKNISLTLDQFPQFKNSWLIELTKKETQLKTLQTKYGHIAQDTAIAINDLLQKNLQLIQSKFKEIETHLSTASKNQDKEIKLAEPLIYTQEKPSSPINNETVISPSLPSPNAKIATNNFNVGQGNTEQLMSKIQRSKSEPIFTSLSEKNSFFLNSAADATHYKELTRRLIAHQTELTEEVQKYTDFKEEKALAHINNCLEKREELDLFANIKNIQDIDKKLTLQKWYLLTAIQKRIDYLLKNSYSLAKDSVLCSIISCKDYQNAANNLRGKGGSLLSPIWRFLCKLFHKKSETSKCIQPLITLGLYKIPSVNTVFHSTEKKTYGLRPRINTS